MNTVLGLLAAVLSLMKQSSPARRGESLAIAGRAAIRWVPHSPSAATAGGLESEAESPYRCCSRSSQDSRDVSNRDRRRRGNNIDAMNQCTESSTSIFHV